LGIAQKIFSGHKESEPLLRLGIVEGCKTLSQPILLVFVSDASRAEKMDATGTNLAS
jgi:hypothetical protein